MYRSEDKRVGSAKSRRRGLLGARGLFLRLSKSDFVLPTGLLQLAFDPGAAASRNVGARGGARTEVLAALSLGLCGSGPAKMKHAEARAEAVATPDRVSHVF